MKKLVTGIFFFATLIVHGQNLQSQLNIRLIDSSAFTMIVDNVRYNHPSNIYNLNLFPGLHYITVQKPYNRVLFNGIVEIPSNSYVHSYIDYNQNFRVISLSGINYSNDRYPGSPNISTAPTKGMDHLSFYNLKVKLYNASSSLDKLKIAKLVIPQATVSSGQLAEFIRIIEFEAHRIELAKYAYQFTVDKENYWVIRESFSFESSMGEVEKFIEEKK